MAPAIHTNLAMKKAKRELNRDPTDEPWPCAADTDHMRGAPVSAGSESPDAPVPPRTPRGPDPDGP